jgi:hypothetical protein
MTSNRIAVATWLVFFAILVPFVIEFTLWFIAELDKIDWQ